MVKNVPVSSTTKPTMLPSADSITDRSRKFYDGTYTWDSDGFIDGMGGKGRGAEHEQLGTDDRQYIVPLTATTRMRELQHRCLLFL